MNSEADIAIVGAGLAGSLSAAVLGRAGHKVCLIDYRAEVPADFRVEKIGGDQLEAMRRLGVLGGVAARSAQFNQIVNVRAGREIDRTRSAHLGILYPDLIQAVRNEVPPQVQRITGRVLDIETAPDRQHLQLQDGNLVAARLVILATGMGDLLRKKLDISRRVIMEQQSLSFGFMLRPRAGSFAFEALTSYGEQPLDALDYLSLFPTPGGMRANLFTFLAPGDERVHDFRRDMRGALIAAMPGLQRYLVEFEVVDKVQTWLMDLAVAENVRQAGVVLIGDAFQTSCPAAGRGVSRLLTDVELLCRDHVPRWFASDGMGADKIAAFYDDRRKQAVDQSALELSHYRRNLAVGRGMKWALRRRQHFLRRRIVGWLDSTNPALVARFRAWRQAAVNGRRPPAGSSALY